MESYFDAFIENNQIRQSLLRTQVETSAAMKPEAFRGVFSFKKYASEVSSVIVFIIDSLNSLHLYLLAGFQLYDTNISINSYFPMYFSM